MQLVSVCGLVNPVKKYEVLLSQRPHHKVLGALWEFPGGKCAKGERPKLALVRELKEELDISVGEDDLMPLSFLTYDTSKTADRSAEDFLVLLYGCRIWQGEVKGKEGQELFWCSFNRLYEVDLLPQNKMFLPALRSFLGA